jgi:hypothetical protein
MDNDSRLDPPVQADERAALSAFLDFHRATLLWKVEGLSQEQLATPAVPTSDLTLAGLLKHLALVEDSWFQEVFLGRELPEPWASAPWAEDRDWEFHTAPTDDPADLVELYRSAADRSRHVVATADSLDVLSVRPDKREEKPFSLRWILLHMIEETARHCGHADLLREAIDGQTGE